MSVIWCFAQLCHYVRLEVILYSRVQHCHDSVGTTIVWAFFSESNAILFKSIAYLSILWLQCIGTIDHDSKTRTYLSCVQISFNEIYLQRCFRYRTSMDFHNQVSELIDQMWSVLKRKLISDFTSWSTLVQDNSVGHLRASSSVRPANVSTSSAAWGVAGTAVAAVGLAMSSRSAKAGAPWRVNWMASQLYFPLFSTCCEVSMCSCIIFALGGELN